eukprot:gnl/Spiro4/22017_TR10821_c0_g1_i1.p1 gnl/Spiro4/22017_TR10821_c0_g1~~gnl/Spiro4/22017_TR10821_c0_g1_i1.p1  ORF type:complete len:417 (+),score=96.96 gnl/Spiro4/22017_TR10821_c0_g1_i1:46-1251(+)
MSSRASPMLGHYSPPKARLYEPVLPNLVSTDYVTQLQRQHQQRIDESLDASSRLMANKEREIAWLNERLREAQSRVQSLTDEHTVEMQRLSREHESRVQQLENEIVRVRDTAAAELDNANRCHMEDLEAARREAEAEVHQMKSWCHEQTRAVEGARDQAIEQLQRQQYEQDAFNTAKMKELNDSYYSQLTELQRLLNDESERLSHAREEVCDLTLRKGSEISELKRKLAEATALHEDGERKSRDEVKRLTDDFRQKEADYQSLVRNIREEQQLERDQANSYIIQYEDRVHALDRSLCDLQEKHEALLSQTDADLSAAASQLESSQKFGQKQLEQNRELMELIAQLQRENSILKNEVGLLESEERRLRDENTQFKYEVSRLDKLIYGSSKPTTTSANHSHRW